MFNNQPTYRADSAVSSSDFSQSGPEVVFYQLGKKFIDTDARIPKEAQDVIYYTMSIGHHTGVIDCFEEKLRCPYEVYEQVVGLFEEGSDARWKLAGILRSSEIQVDKTNLAVLAQPVQDLCEKLDAGLEASPEASAWVHAFRGLLAVLVHEPAAYLMGRVRIK